MPRPKSPDPKRAVTLRLHSSVLDRYEAMGEGYRAKMEALLIAGVAPKARVAEPVKPALSVAVPFGPAVTAPGSRLKKR